VTGSTLVKETSSIHSPYFVLSYAHSDPLAGYPRANPDRLVGRFFGHLVAAVRRQASSRSEFVPGFCDQQVPVGSDLKESLIHAMGTAQVLVPLYSAGYIAKSWPGRELACFRRRVIGAGVDDPESRIVPVLWTSLPEAQDPPGLREALALGADEPGYTENGLRALLNIGWYRDSYQAVVNVLAKRIVALAEESPIGPSEVPDIDKMKSPFLPESRLAVFAIETAAPTIRTVAQDHDPSGYGESSAEWHPFPEQEISLAEYARQVAERLDFKAEVSGIKPVSDSGMRRPGIILIDPWFIADEDGRSALESAVNQLPRWVLPLLILDKPDDPRTRDLAGQVREILGALPTVSSRQAAQGVSSLRDFIHIVPRLVAEAERQYLRYRSGRVPSQPSGKRPSLRGPARPDDPANMSDRPTSTQHTRGETPDA
jgi:FxsC-like protein